MGGPNSQDNKGVNNPAPTSSGHAIDVPPDPDMIGGYTQRLMADFSAAAGQFDEKDINDSQKIDWLLSKLHLDQDEKDGYAKLLQEQAKTRDPGEVLGEWKMIVVTLWAESDKLAREEEEEQEKERQRTQDARE